MVDSNFCCQNGICIIDGRITINGIIIPPCPSSSKSVTVINNKVFVGGYEWISKRRKWKRTMRLCLF